eukprot:m.356409 g.356409  ORF g.356409 m.356409 type:complete len:395 (+) comp17539_c0_seq1:182-1366(+)
MSSSMPNYWSTMSSMVVVVVVVIGVVLTLNTNANATNPNPSAQEQEQESDTMADQPTMKAILIPTFGPPENMVLGDAPIPEVKETEVLVKVYATAVNRADTLQRKGVYNPPPGCSPIMGLEAAGVVEKVGSGCTTAKVGQKVFALLTGGGYAEYCAVDEGQVMIIPDSFTFTQAAAVAETWLTAFQLLTFVASISAGDHVLIHAGGSGVGLAATQLVVAMGGTAVVTAGSDSKIEAAVSVGAKGGANRHNGPWAETVMGLSDGHGFDIILDCVGGSYSAMNAEVIAAEGTWVVYGLMGGADVEGALLRTLLRKRATIRGTTLRARPVEYKRELVAKFSEFALPRLASGEFKVIIDEVLPLSEMATAHSHMEANKNTGKIVLEVIPGASKTRDEL